MWSPSVIAEKLMERLRTEAMPGEVTFVTKTSRRTRAMRFRKRTLSARLSREIRLKRTQFDPEGASSTGSSSGSLFGCESEEGAESGGNGDTKSGRFGVVKESSAESAADRGGGGAAGGGGGKGDGRSDEDGGGSEEGTLSDEEASDSGEGGVNNESSGVDASHVDENNVTYVRRRRIKNKRNRAIHIPPHIQAGLERRQEEEEREGCRGCFVASFGVGRHFANDKLVREAVVAHAAATYTTVQFRTSRSVAVANRMLLNAAKKKARRNSPGGTGSDETVQLWPEELGFVTMYVRCSHGVIRKKKEGEAFAQHGKKGDECEEVGSGVVSSKGKREPKMSKFTGCEAQISFKAVRDADTGVCTLVSYDEANYHNHDCSLAMIAANGKSPLLQFPKLQKRVRRLLQGRSSSRDICDTIAAEFGIAITPKQIANLRRDRLGGSSAAATFKLLIERFASFSGSRCLVIEDQDGNICGVAIQSAAQRLIFDMYGENLILDWTHNTNNLGFYLGSLMVTSATGRGVSVFDFLCIEQTEAMMTTVLNYFVKINPRATERVKSFVIDKDYKEWRVLERVFPKSTVLLCQFHVLKWFAYAVTQSKYKINTVKLRDEVLDVVYSMVYAKTTVQFDLCRNDLKRLLQISSPQFLEYMDKRWYNCRKMWSDCERGQVFTAMNTTSNRIESSWNQVKKILGKKLRIDRCLEAIFAYQTAVLRREYRIFNKYAHTLVLRSSCDPFMRSALADVSEYSAGIIQGQWSAYLRHDSSTSDGYVATRTHTHSRDSCTFHVTRPAAHSRTYSVKTDSLHWECSCDFMVSSGLPCRHMIYVAKHSMQLGQFPPTAVLPRWRMRNAYPILPQIVANTTEIQSLRSGLLLGDIDFVERLEAGIDVNGQRRKKRGRRIEYFRLRRYEKKNVVVMNNVEKRSVLAAEMAPLTKVLMTVSTPAFMKIAAELRAFVAEKLREVAGRPAPKNVDDNEGLEEVRAGVNSNEGVHGVGAEVKEGVDGADADDEDGVGDEGVAECPVIARRNVGAPTVHDDPDPHPSTAGTDVRDERHVGAPVAQHTDELVEDNARSTETRFCGDVRPSAGGLDYVEGDVDHEPGSASVSWLEEEIENAEELDLAIAEAIADEESNFLDAEHYHRRGGMHPGETHGVSGWSEDIAPMQDSDYELFMDQDVFGQEVELTVGIPLEFPAYLKNQKSGQAEPVASISPQTTQGRQSPSHSPRRQTAVTTDRVGAFTPVCVAPLPTTVLPPALHNSTVSPDSIDSTVPPDSIVPPPAEHDSNAPYSPDSNAPHSPQSVLSVSTSTLSAIMTPVVAHHMWTGAPATLQSTHSQRSYTSVSTSTRSAIFHSVADHHIRTTAASLAGKRRASGPADSINIIRDLAIPEEDGVEQPNIELETLHRNKKAKGAIRGRVKSEKEGTARDKSASDFPALPSPIVVGRTKLQSTSGRVGDRWSYQDQSSDLPIELSLCSQAISSKPDVFSLRGLWEIVPRRLDGEAILRTSTFAQPESYNPKDFPLNFRIRRSLLASIKSSMDRSRILIRTGKISEEPIDCTRDDPSLTTGLVLRMGQNHRAFTEENVADLIAFADVRDKIESLRELELWLLSRFDAVTSANAQDVSTGGKANAVLRQAAGREFAWTGNRIPYLLAKIEVQNVIDATVPEAGDVDMGAKAAILRVLTTCSMRTRFSIKTQREELAGTIAVSDLAGSIAGQTRLNDCVLCFALRQMAADYGDVHVFDSVAPPRPCAEEDEDEEPSRAFGPIPHVSLSTFRWVIFPVNYSNVHWTVIFARISKAGVEQVGLYDPTQNPGYEARMMMTWKTSCMPALQEWAAHDGSLIVLPVVSEEGDDHTSLSPSVNGEDTSDPGVDTIPKEYVRLESQHDMDSCGVYCVAAAFDRISETYFFAKEGKVGKAYSDRLRVRILWRMLFDSKRSDPDDAKPEVRNAISVLTKRNETGGSGQSTFASWVPTRRSLKSRKAKV